VNSNSNECLKLLKIKRHYFKIEHFSSFLALVNACPRGLHKQLHHALH
jgi:hypothetical protein